MYQNINDYNYFFFLEQTEQSSVPEDSIRTVLNQNHLMSKEKRKKK